MFLQSAIPIFDSFNTFLPAEEPLIYILYHSTLRLYCSLFSRFILFQVILEPDDVLRIDLEDLDVLKDFNSIFIGQVVCKRQWHNWNFWVQMAFFFSAWNTPNFIR